MDIHDSVVIKVHTISFLPIKLINLKLDKQQKNNYVIERSLDLVKHQIVIKGLLTFKLSVKNTECN